MRDQSEIKRIEVLAIIPARGESKSIPKKNICLLADKPLIEYTFDAAKRSKAITRIVLSTDNEQIADLGKKNGIDVPMLRPAELAADDMFPKSGCIIEIYGV